MDAWDILGQSMIPPQSESHVVQSRITRRALAHADPAAALLGAVELERKLLQGMKTGD